MHNCTVLVRSSGERTEGLCVDLLEYCLPSEEVHVIRETPFAKAVIESFRLGIESDRKWTMTVDADVLVRREALQTMIDRAESFPGDLFIYQGYVLDFLFNKYREGGPHLYKTKHLPQAMKYVMTKGGSLRPESDAYHKMAEQGYAFWVDAKVYGIHDYYQYRCDLVRKAYVHAIKHQSLVPVFLEEWIHSLDDEDKRAAIVGMLTGLVETGDIEPDIRRLRPLAQRLMEQYRILEKDQSIDLDSPKSNVVDDILSAYQSMLNRTSRNISPLRVKHFPAREFRDLSAADIAMEYSIKPVARRLAKVLLAMGEHFKRFA